MTICSPWRVADALNRLLDQLNARAPGRSKASDGSLGDDAHQAEGACGSEHNSCCIRYNGVWIVRARDFTHDPLHGADMHLWADALRRSRDRRIRYIIWNRHVTGPNHTDGAGNWVWDAYSGTNPHDKHMHVSTFNDAARFDNTAPWAGPAGYAQTTGGDDMGVEVFKDVSGDATSSRLSQGVAGYAGQQRDTAIAFTWKAAVDANANTVALLEIVKVIAAKVDVDTAELDAIEQRAKAGAKAALQEDRAAFIAALKAELPVGPDGAYFSLAEIESAAERATRRVFTDAAEPDVSAG